MNNYVKTITALLGTVGTWGITASDGGISSQEWFGLVVALATAVGVYALPNTSKAPVAENIEP